MADSLKTVLGFDAAGAIATLTAMETKLVSWTAAMRDAASTTRKFNTSAKSTDATLKANTAATRGAVAATQQQTLATNKATGAYYGHVKAVKKMDKASKDMVLTWKSVVRIFAIQVIHQMISKITSSLVEGAAAARNYEKALAEIQTIGAEFQGDFEGLADKVEAFAAATGQPLPAVTEGIYQTLSNQVVSAGQSFEFLSTASDFAIAAVTDLDSAVNLLSSTINSYGMSNTEAEVAAGKLFKTIELGRIRGEEFADTFGRVLVLSAQLGVAFDEVLASMATLTVSGLKYNEAFTLITNVQLKLIKPTDNLKKRFDELGVATAEAGIQAYGYQGFLEKIMEGSDGTATAIGEMFSRVRAIRGVLGLANDHAEKYVDNLKKIKEASAETLIKAKAFIWETNAKQVELELNRVNIELTRLGRVATSAGLAIMGAFGGGPEALAAIGVGLTATIGFFVAVKVAAVTTIGTLIAGFTSVAGAIASVQLAAAALAASPLFWAVAVGAAAATAIVWYNKAAAAAKKADDAIIASRERRWKNEQRNLDNQLRATEETTSKQLSAIQKFLFERAKLYQEATKVAAALESRQFTSINNQLSGHAGAIQSFFDAVIAKSEEANQKIKEIEATISGVKASLSDWNFERAMKGADPLRATYAKIERSEQLRAAASRAARRGDVASAEALNQRAEAAAKAAVASADQSKSGVAIRKAEEQVNLAMQSQISLLKHAKKEVKDQTSLAKEVEAAYRSQSTKLDELTAKFKDLKIQAADVKLDIVDRKKVEDEMREVASSLEAMFIDFGKNINIAKQLNLKEDFTVATRGFFDPVTGQVDGFETVVNASINRIEDRFASFAATATNDMKKMQKVIDSLVGPGTPKEQQALVLQLGKEIEKAGNATRDNREAQNQLNTELDRQVGLENQFLIAAKKSLQVQIGTAISKETMVTAEKNAAAEAIVVVSLYREATNLLKEGKGNTDEFATVMGKLGDATERITKLQAGEGFFTDLLSGDRATALQTIVESLNKAASASITIKETQDQMNFGDKIIEQLKVSAETIETFNKSLGTDMVIAADTGTRGIESAAQKQVAALKAVTAAAKEAAAATAMSGGGPVGKMFGGVIYRAGGGFTPKGTDTIPAMLSPGEFVVNAAASKKFFSQLVAINSGTAPVYREEGGPVTNIGDVNINVTESQSARSTARETMSAFRREMRRRSSTL